MSALLIKNMGVMPKIDLLNFLLMLFTFKFIHFQYFNYVAFIVV